ncbi:MAG: hypothetical protein KatS3mg019_0866 [Fimbriimonadales bacterium]|nr:MAG: hypothetical protein KatS3mg019_0866 [Fimbriimonadales bacterium]
MQVVGVDGCRGGWLAVVLDVGTLTVQVSVFTQFAEILDAYPDAAAIAVDMPIGLWSSGRARMRPCDAQARRLLGKHASSVFIPPTRAMLDADSYDRPREQGLSVQAYHLIPRIRELDALMTPELQTRVWESHPELSFRVITGAPIEHPKRTAHGQLARIEALQHALHLEFETLNALWQACPPAVRRHDLLDACALAWSAQRHTLGQSDCCLGEPTHDERGLLMAIRF